MALIVCQRQAGDSELWDCGPSSISKPVALFNVLATYIGLFTLNAGD